MPPDCFLRVEDKFGPIVDGCGSNFDFTLLFEESALFLLPICVAICLAVLRVLQIRRGRAVVKGGFLLPLKLSAWTLALASQIAFLALVSTRSGLRTRASTAAGSVGIVGCLVLACLSHIEHRRAVRTSFILVLYLLATIPMDAFRARTLWRMLGGRDPAIALTVFAGSKVCALLLELLWKCSLTYERGMCDAPEESHGIVERALMLRMLPVFWAGYRVTLEPKHLFQIHGTLLTGQADPMAKTMSGRLLGGRAASDGPRNLTIDMFLAHRREALLPILPRLLAVALAFAQPFLVSRAVEYTSGPSGENHTRKGLGLIAAYALVYYGIAVTTSLYEQQGARFATVVRADLAMRIYQHSLELDRVAVDDKDASTTMMTADLERVQQGVRKLHDAWANILSVAIGLWLVKLELGLSSLVTLALIGGSLLLGAYWSGRAGQFQKTWMEAIEKRLHKTVQVFKGIKTIKQLGAAQEIHDTLSSERAAEIGLSKAFRLQLIALVTLSYTSLTMLPALGFAMHVATSKSHPGQLLSANTAFHAMTLFQLVSTGIQEGIAHAMEVMVAVGCLARVGLFLNEHTWTDSRKRVGADESSSEIGLPPNHPLGDSEKRDMDVAVRFDKVSARWADDDSGEMIIPEASFHVPLYGLTVIVGPTGSGKSTLLQVALGDLKPTSGSVYICDPHVAFCSQSPWIANISIRDNIVGASLFQADRYRNAIQMCALERDLKEMAGGDEHLCGLNGQSLSGGQKVRVALARAVYSQAKVVMLDDCLVGLDTDTERHILDNIFGPNGALSSAPITTILATSSPRYIALADHVVFVDAHGSVVQEGSSADIAPHIGEIEQETALAPKRAEAEDTSGPSASALLPSAAATNDPAANRGADGDFAVYQWYFRAIGWGNLAAFLFLSMLFVVGVIYPQIWLNTWTDKDGEAQRDTLPTFYGIFFGVGSLAWLAFAASCLYMFLRIAVRTAYLFHRLLLSTVLNAPMEFFSKTNSGITLNRFSQDLQITDMELPLAFIGTTMNVFMLVAQCIAVTIALHYAALAILAIAIFIGGFHELYLRTSRRLRLMDIESRAPVLSLLLESLDGLSTVRAYRWAEWYLRRGIPVLGQSQLPFHLLQSAQVTLYLTVDLFVATLAVVVVSIAVASNSSSGGSIGLALFNIVGLGISVKGVVYFWTSLEITLGALARVRDFTTETESENDCDVKPSPDWPPMGSIRFENLTVAHSRSLPPTLTNLSLTIQPGSKVALCGRTGSGKSTLLNSLLRLSDITAGRILVDNVDISTLSREEVRSRFVVVPQDALQLSVSARAFARLHGIDDDDLVVRGLREAGLWTIIERGGGLDMIMTEDALSHGQRQLFSLTLACLKRGKVVLMDEPTSRVDKDIQSQLHRAVFDTCADSTVICISHQIETILDFDIVAVLDNGAIVEIDNPKELMLRPGSRFAQLYSAGEH